ncbi:hypothetical protein BT93_E0138 [Corymbia citriodora subsp. variegata]|nr:hypothetical protein BT93_E0138 [Corymbia citriodora subsp. variegata]KAF8027124.1 hypothetical protein BT93_E0138 [Corymbia citriodora subsp. variegata]KAF8027125.1 hypothetical protein BT93_E0138 [Corymbia citriodora subsp. variegata]KAF8027126.1 hypothetical protein BT93_E0138 [Corymbia citriodora subsp. variegata]
MDDLPLQKIAISGPTLSSLLQRVSSSPADADGLLFGHVLPVAPASLSDDPSSAAAAAAASASGSSDSTALVATVTSFLCPGCPLSFFDSLGRVLSPALLLRHSQHRLIGWFSSRRRSRLQPSMREFNIAASLSSDPSLSFPIDDGAASSNGFSPRVFLLFSTPPLDSAIHTHEYRAFQFRTATDTFEPRSVDVVNIGPGFRGHYGNFSPNSSFPWLACDLRGSSMMQEDSKEERLSEMRQAAKYQNEIDLIAEGFPVAKLSRLVGSEASNYTAGLEEMYEKMLTKVDSLARLVEAGSAQVVEMEQHNSKLRAEVAGIKRVVDG